MLRIAFLLLVLLVTGCNIVHKQNIQQGNVLDRENMERLETGMTKRQVMVLLGSPAVQSPFHSNRWDYINSFAPRGGEAERRKLTIEFENDRVVDFSGNYLENAEMAGTDLEELEIIDPNTNQPVLPPTELQDDDPVPTPNDPPGGG